MKPTLPCTNIWTLDAIQLKDCGPDERYLKLIEL